MVAAIFVLEQAENKDVLSLSDPKFIEFDSSSPYIT